MCEVRTFSSRYSIHHTLIELVYTCIERAEEGVKSRTRWVGKDIRQK